MVKKKVAKKITKKSSRKIRKKSNLGQRYSCKVCGIVVRMERTCGCADVHEIVCCGKAMSKKK